MTVFLAQLNPAEKAAFARLARDLVALGGVLAAETEMLEAAFAQLGVPADAGAGLGFEAACAAFGSPRAKKIALMELMLLAKADGAVQAAEQAFAERVAAALGLGADDLAYARRWAALSLEPYRIGVRWLGTAAG